MLATTYVAHYNAPKFYSELTPPKDGGSKASSTRLTAARACQQHPPALLSAAFALCRGGDTSDI